jgi:HPr kinase/phosphorylase
VTDPVTLHASAVALDGRAVLIIGASGSGKSALALGLMAYGADLIADDRVILQGDQHGVIARCPSRIAGLVEARGIGILTAASCDQARVVLVVDLDQRSDKRLPDPVTTRLCGHDLRLIGRIDAPHFAAIILQILRSGWARI